jgi:hypothetical protein
MSEMGGGVIEMALGFMLLMIVAVVLFFVFGELFGNKDEETEPLNKPQCS